MNWWDYDFRDFDTNPNVIVNIIINVNINLTTRRMIGPGVVICLACLGWPGGGQAQVQSP